ncbi:MAG: hypothetical protein Q7S51_00280 [Gallionellaceae bacterium]|nr:hypothetical protein [Gallionellaceae bacterium]
MRTLTQTVLSFKVEATEALLTANAGLALFGEFTQGLGLHRWLKQEMPQPGSKRGYGACASWHSVKQSPRINEVTRNLARHG